MTYRFANSAVQGYLSGVRSPYWAVIRSRHRVDDGGPAGLDLTSLTNEWMKALVSVRSLVVRTSFISSAKAAMVSGYNSLNFRHSLTNAGLTASLQRSLRVLTRMFANMYNHSRRLEPTGNDHISSASL